MGRVRTAAFEDQRGLILAQAARLFARNGYTATSMNEVAAASGVSKPTLYHYVQDKHELLLCVAEFHIARLQALVDEVQALGLPPRERLVQLVQRFVAAYAEARNEHRVLTEDVKFLGDEARARVVAGQRRVVAVFADTLVQMRPDLSGSALAKPLTMLLFGMMNWMFTWLRPEGAIRCDSMAEVVTELFLGGLGSVQVPATTTTSSRSTPPKKETCS